MEPESVSLSSSLFKATVSRRHSILPMWTQHVNIYLVSGCHMLYSIVCSFLSVFNLVSWEKREDTAQGDVFTQKYLLIVYLYDISLYAWKPWW